MRTVSFVAKTRLCILASLLAVLPTAPALATSGGEGIFLQELRQQALRKGVSSTIFDRAVAGFKMEPKVTEQARSQPESVTTVGDYVTKRASAQRIVMGRGKLTSFSQLLARIERSYGVPAPLILSIWGVETNFGSFMGGNNVIHALATLTHEKYRERYFRSELFAALQILQAGHIQPEDMVGSWAGAMGQTQFMPSSFNTYAVDFTGDGRADIWNSEGDAFASTANYLQKNGWRHGESWGYEVRLPASFDFAGAWDMERATLRQWQAVGLKRADGRAFPRLDDQARFYLPSGAGGPAFLLLKNFDVIKRYNNSDSYALAVAHLSDRIAGAEPLTNGWPADVLPLTKKERQELQARLTTLGFDTEGTDGRLGPRTRSAIVGFQKVRGLTADAFPSRQLLEQVRATGRNHAYLEQPR